MLDTSERWGEDPTPSHAAPEKRCGRRSTTPDGEASGATSKGEAIEAGFSILLIAITREESLRREDEVHQAFSTIREEVGEGADKAKDLLSRNDDK